MNEKAKVLLWLGVGILSILPFPTAISLPVTVTLTLEDGTPLPDVQIWQEWESFGLTGRGRDEVKTDAHGLVTFSEKKAYGSLIGRSLGRALTLIAVHSSYGASIKLGFTAPKSVEAVFRPPAFQPYGPNRYRDSDGRYYSTNVYPSGQYLSVEGDFLRYGNPISFILIKRKPNQAPEPTAPSGRGSS